MTAARDHKNLHILPENSAGESAAGVTYLSMRIRLKRCRIKRSCLKRIRGYDTVKKGGGSRHSIAK